MRAVIVASAALLPALSALAQGPVPAQAAKTATAATDPLVVHEWGTFTSMQGSDGVSLEGLHWEEEKLPGFVHSLTRFGQQQQNEPLLQKKLSRPVRRVTQKMETPVIYFHTKTRRKVRVQVDFVNGLMTQWYPVAERMWPWPSQLRTRAVTGNELPFDMRTIKRSHLRWHVELIPLSEGLPKGIPAVRPEDPWQFAREVSAASVRTIPRKGGKVKPQTERYLFYRGLGTFKLPMRVLAARRGKAYFTNGDKHRIPFALAMEVGTKGGRMKLLGSVQAHQDVSFSLVDQAFVPIQRFVGVVQGRMIKALHQQGLGVDEATAMVRTWSRQWFRSRGHRVIYFLPRPRVDQLLPLKITPVPHRLVRVLVGRLEYLTPEVEDSVARNLQGRLSTDAGERARAEQELKDLGRFLEPKVRRILARSQDPNVLKSGKQLLESTAR